MQLKTEQTHIQIHQTDELFHVLEKMVGLHRTLIGVLAEEYAHMTAVDVKGLFETAQTKEVLVNEIWNLEKLRIQVADTISKNLNTNSTLESIANALPKTTADRLRSSKTVLSMLMDQAKELNLRNMSFAENSLIRIDEMKKNILGNNNNNRENYSNSGTRQPINEQGGRLLSTEA